MPDSQQIPTSQTHTTRAAANSHQGGVSLPAVPVFKELKETSEEDLQSVQQQKRIAEGAGDDGNDAKGQSFNGNAFRSATVQKKDAGEKESQGLFVASHDAKKGEAVGQTLKPFSPAAGAGEKANAGSVVQRQIMLPETMFGGGRVDELTARLLPVEPPVKEVLTSWATDGVYRYFVSKEKMIERAEAELTARPEKARMADSKLSSVVAALISDEANPDLLDDASLLDILKTAFGANWFKAKSCLAFGEWPWTATRDKPHPPHAKSMKLMLAIVSMRLREWERFRAKVTPAARREFHDDTIQLMDPDGSISVTSDLDVSVKGKESEKAIKFLNDEFRSMYSIAFDPGTFFDLNFYSLDWMHGLNEKISPDDPGSPAGDATATLTPDIEKNLSAAEVENNPERAKSQEEWSYVKIMRNLGPDDITLYKSQILSNFSMGSMARVDMQVKLESAERKTAAFKAAISANIAAMEGKLTREQGPIEAAFNDGLNSTKNNAAYLHEAATMRVSNDLYQKAVVRVREIRQRIETVKKAPRPQDADPLTLKALANLLADTIAEALTYANEVYATEGGVLHTVFGKQKADKMQKKYSESSKASERAVKKVKTTLTSNQYMESINENVGDSIHSINAYLTKPQYGAFRAGKYIERMVEAVDFLYVQEAARLRKEASTLPDYLLLKGLGASAAEHKKGELGKDPLLAKTTPPFNEYDKAKLEGLKTKIFTFGAEASGHYKKVFP